MNRLNKIVISFVLPFFVLLFNVSYAYIEPDIQYTKATGSPYINTTTLFGYSRYEIGRIIYLHLATGETENFNKLVESASQAGYNYFIFNDSSIISKYYCFVPKDMDVGFYKYSSTDSCYNLCIEASLTQPVYFGIYNSNNGVMSDTTTLLKQYALSTIDNGLYYETFYYINSLSSTSFFEANCNVKVLGNPVIWDGVTYLHKVEPDTPSLPSNSEIAQAVQAFYNSDYYKNNKDFEDFIVMYNYETKYFDFIGHNFEDKFQQLIFPAGHIYNERWWKFSLDGLTTQASSYLFNKYYWLYSTNDFGENIKYEGKGSINDLLDLRFATSSIIVYSTNEYDVVVYTYDENDEFVSSEMETMPGDQYTYDENLDPTTNEYNPLENFVPTNPSQTILGDVDFNEINKVFEENKDILNIEGASWLFTANNQLTNYFLGFLSLLIVFLIISRILGG